jgi:hypothetical protein
VVTPLIVYDLASTGVWTQTPEAFAQYAVPENKVPPPATEGAKLRGEEGASPTEKGAVRRSPEEVKEQERIFRNLLAQDRSPRTPQEPVLTKELAEAWGTIYRPHSVQRPCSLSFPLFHRRKSLLGQQSGLENLG